MGKVALTFRVLPEVDTSLDALQRDLAHVLGDRLKRVEEKPFAFGLHVLEVLAIVPDEAGQADAVEQLLGAVKGVQSVQVTGQSLI